MGVRAVRLARSDQRPARALARALRSVALGAVPSDESDWSARIEAWRRALTAEHAARTASSQSRGGASSRLIEYISLPPVWGLFLMRLVRELAPRSCVELGTGFGISAAYQAAALELRGEGRIATLDGSAELMAQARRGFSSLGLERVETCVGPLSETLEETLGRIAPIDYALLDAEHTEEATLRHFDALVPHLAADAVVVLDDIPWPARSPWTLEMRGAWRTIKRSDSVAMAIDLGRMGVIVTPGR